MIAASLPDSEAVVKLLLQRDAFIDEKSTLTGGREDRSEFD